MYIKELQDAIRLPNNDKSEDAYDCLGDSGKTDI